MPSRKFSVNSQFSVSSQKTSGSSSNGTTFYRRAASVHQINELYAALNELIHSPPVDRRRNTGDSSVSSKSQWSSEGNLLDYDAKLPPRANSEVSHMRPSRSASCLSSKSCYAAIGSKSSNVTLQVAARNTESPKSGGIYSKIVAKFRGKKSGEKTKSMQRKYSMGEEQVNAIDGGKAPTIEDLIEMANSNANAKGKGNARDKRRKFKALGRTKANSFDSCEPDTPNICVHKVSSKLKTWYTRAVSYAATIEHEDRSRAESSCTGSTDNFLESSGYESKGEITNADVTVDEELVVRDFDVSSPDILAESELKDKPETQAEELKTSRVRKLQRRAASDLKPIKPDILLKRSFSNFESTDDVFEKDDGAASRILSKTLWKSENRCDLIRRLSLNIVEDVLAGKSASCEQIGSTRLNRDLSKRKVQQWLKDLNTNDERKSGLKCKEDEACPSDAHGSGPVDGEAAESTPSTKKFEKGASEIAEIPSGARRLPDQPMFYIPNIGKAEQQASVNIIINF